MALDIILRVPACAPVNEVADFIAEAEKAGFAGVGIPDTQLVTRDAFVALALAAERTSRIMLYPAVTNPVTRHVSVIASLVRTIEELAPGRVHVMLGTGYSAVRTIGRRPATLASMRECVTRLRQLLGAEELDFDGAPSHLQFASGEVPPIILTARGPRALALAGEIGDGVMANVALHPNTIAWGRSHVSQGASVSGRDLSPESSFLEMFDISTHIAPTHEEALHQARHVCAHWVTQPALVNLLQGGRGGSSGDDLPSGVAERVSRLVPRRRPRGGCEADLVPVRRDGGADLWRPRRIWNCKRGGGEAGDGCRAGRYPHPHQDSRNLLAATDHP